MGEASLKRSKESRRVDAQHECLVAETREQRKCERAAEIAARQRAQHRALGSATEDGEGVGALRAAPRLL